MFGLTRERARQIEEHAVRKLASLAEAQGLREAA
jgi:DNA-directed RNA polymerase sigma subunit (sigma70/sigma32)